MTNDYPSTLRFHPWQRISTVTTAIAVTLFAFAFESKADNGAVAVGTVLKNITVDGDLSDWPDEMRRHSVQLTECGSPPDSEDDLSATFRVGYCKKQQAIFVAVEVHDDSIVVREDGEVSLWNNQDGCEVYLDRADREQGSAVEQYSRYGDSDEVYGAADEDRVDVAVVQASGHRIYEWRIEVDQPIDDPRVLGFDVSVTDMDEDGTFSWTTWGTGVAKQYSGSRTGDLLLAIDPDATGVLTGQLQSTPSCEEVEGEFPTIAIRSVSNAQLHVCVECDSDGQFAATLPAGTYKVAAKTADPDSDDYSSTIEVSANAESDAGELKVPDSAQSAKHPSHHKHHHHEWKEKKKAK